MEEEKEMLSIVVVTTSPQQNRARKQKIKIKQYFDPLEFESVFKITITDPTYQQNQFFP